MALSFPVIEITDGYPSLDYSVRILHSAFDSNRDQLSIRYSVPP